MTMQVIRADERDLWRDAAVISRQSFPATGSFDLAANAFGLLLVHNDDVVSPGEGFDMHAHRDVEIVTWVVSGRLRHRDSGAEEATELGPGQAQHISAGRGVRHSEVNAAGWTSRERLRVIQSWLPADVPGTAPFHTVHDFTAALADAPLTPVASGTPGAAPLTLGTAGAALWAGRPAAGTRVDVPAARFVHLYIVRGAVTLDGRGLREGDAARLTDAGPRPVEVTEDAELLVWAMDRGARQPSN